MAAAIARVSLAAVATKYFELLLRRLPEDAVVVRSRQGHSWSRPAGRRRNKSGRGAARRRPRASRRFSRLLDLDSSVLNLDSKSTALSDPTVRFLVDILRRPRGKHRECLFERLLESSASTATANAIISSTRGLDCIASEPPRAVDCRLVRKLLAAWDIDCANKINAYGRRLLSRYATGRLPRVSAASPSAASRRLDRMLSCMTNFCSGASPIDRLLRLAAEELVVLSFGADTGSAEVTLFIRDHLHALCPVGATIAAASHGGNQSARRRHLWIIKRFATIYSTLMGSVSDASAFAASLYDSSTATVPAGAFSLYCDGASRGNPGLAGCGSVLYDYDGRVVTKLSSFVGENSTNNEAEYEGVIRGVDNAMRVHGVSQLCVFLDSQLIVNHYNGDASTRAPKLRPLLHKLVAVCGGLQLCQFGHVLRALNTVADELANAGIDDWLLARDGGEGGAVGAGVDGCDGAAGAGGGRGGDGAAGDDGGGEEAGGGAADGAAGAEIDGARGRDGDALVGADGGGDGGLEVGDIADAAGDDSLMYLLQRGGVAGCRWRDARWRIVARLARGLASFRQPLCTFVQRSAIATDTLCSCYLPPRSVRAEAESVALDTLSLASWNPGCTMASAEKESFRQADRVLREEGVHIATFQEIMHTTPPPLIPHLEYAAALRPCHLIGEDKCRNRGGVSIMTRFPSVPFDSQSLPESLFGPNVEAIGRKVRLRSGFGRFHGLFVVSVYWRRVASKIAAYGFDPSLLVAAVRRAQADGWLPVLLGDFNLSPRLKTIPRDLRNFLSATTLAVANGPQASHVPGGGRRTSQIDLVLVPPSLLRHIKVFVHPVGATGHSVVVAKFNRRKVLIQSTIPSSADKALRLLMSCTADAALLADWRLEIDSLLSDLAPIDESGMPVDHLTPILLQAAQTVASKVGYDRLSRQSVAGQLLFKAQALYKSRLRSLQLLLSTGHSKLLSPTDRITQLEAKADVRRLRACRRASRKEENASRRTDALTSAGSNQRRLWAALKDAASPSGRGVTRTAVKRYDHDLADPAKQTAFRSFWSDIWAKKDIQSRGSIEARVLAALTAAERLADDGGSAKWSAVFRPPDDKGVRKLWLADEREIGAAIRHLSSNTVGGKSKVTVAAIKAAGKGARRFIARIFNAILEKRSYPTQWAAVLLSLLHKKGDVDDPAMYRPIALTEALWRIAETVLLLRMSPHVEDHLSEAQFGFRAGRSTIDLLAVLITLDEAALHRGEPLYVPMLDAYKAFDSADHDFIILGYAESGADAATLQLMRAFMEGHHFELGKDRLACNGGVLQGGILSPQNYNVFSDSLGAIPIACGAKLSEDGSRVPVLKFADDNTLASNGDKDIQDLLNGASDWAAARGTRFVVGAGKCVMMVGGRQGSARFADFTLGGQVLPRVTSHRQLGMKFSSAGGFGFQVTRFAKDKSKLEKQVALLGFAARRVRVAEWRQLVHACLASSALYGCHVAHPPKWMLDSLVDAARRAVGKRAKAFAKGPAILEALGIMSFHFFVVQRSLHFFHRMKNGGGDDDCAPLARLREAFEVQQALNLPLFRRASSWIDEFGLRPLWELLHSPDAPEPRVGEKLPEWRPWVKAKCRDAQRNDWSRDLNIKLQYVSPLPHGSPLYKHDLGDGEGFALFHFRNYSRARVPSDPRYCPMCSARAPESPRHYIMYCSLDRVAWPSRRPLRVHQMFLRALAERLGDDGRRGVLQPDVDGHLDQRMLVITMADLERKEARAALRAFRALWRSRNYAKRHDDRRVAPPAVAGGAVGGGAGGAAVPAVRAAAAAVVRAPGRKKRVVRTVDEKCMIAVLWNACKTVAQRKLLLAEKKLTAAAIAKFTDLAVDAGKVSFILKPMVGIDKSTVIDDELRFKAARAYSSLLAEDPAFSTIGLARQANAVTGRIGVRLGPEDIDNWIGMYCPRFDG